MADTRTAKAEERADAAAARAHAKALRPWYKKKRVVIPLVLLALVIIAAVTNSSDPVGDERGPAAGVTDPNGSDAPKGNSLFPGRADVKERDIERNIGQAAELSGYTATVTGSQFLQEVSPFERDGYLVADVAIQNRDDEAQSYNVFEWKLLTPGGQIIDPTFATVDGQLQSGDLVKGGSVAGRIVWEVGSQRGDYFVIYDPSDLGDDRAVWKATV